MPSYFCEYTLLSEQVHAVDWDDVPSFQQEIYQQNCSESTIDMKSRQDYNISTYLGTFL